MAIDFKDIMNRTRAGVTSQELFNKAGENIIQGDTFGKKAAGLLQGAAAPFVAALAPVEAFTANIGSDINRFKSGVKEGLGYNQQKQPTLERPLVTTDKSNAGTDQKTGSATQPQQQDVTNQVARANSGATRSGQPQNGMPQSVPKIFQGDPASYQAELSKRGTGQIPEFNNANVPQMQWQPQQPMPQWVYDQQAKEAEDQRVKAAYEDNVAQKNALESLNPAVRAAALRQINTNNAIISQRGQAAQDSINVGRQVALGQQDQLNRQQLMQQQNQFAEQQPQVQMQKMQLDAIRGLVDAQKSGDPTKIAEATNQLNMIRSAFGQTEKKADVKPQAVEYTINGRSVKTQFNQEQMDTANKAYETYAAAPEIQQINSIKDPAKKQEVINKVLVSMSQNMPRQVAEYVLYMLTNQNAG